MNLRKQIFTNNLCYKAGKQIVPRGIMVHSTAANNPTLKRYVGPDDGLLGRNLFQNDWNRAKTYYGKDFRKCCHAFIGKLADGTVATYQTLPWLHRAWHCAGPGNDTHVSFEICEDNLKDPVYFQKVYTEAAELCAYLCNLYHIPVSGVIGHYEGWRQGIANNHGDPQHWFRLYGKSMATFRADVARLLKGEEAPPETRLYQATVITRLPKSLNIWTTPARDRKTGILVPRGATADVIGIINETWALVRYGAQTGYVDRQYLKPI